MTAQRNQTRSRPSGKSRNRQIVGSGAARPRVQMAPASQNMSAQRRGDHSVRHREMERIGSVPGSVSFGIVANYAINPALSTTFPWLSGVAQHYESYTIENLVVRYKNLKGTDADGNVIISYDPDTLDGGPASAIQQTQSCAYIDGAVWRIFEMRVPCRRERLYTRTGPVVGGDLKTYDAGRIWISAEGCADTSTHGYLELEYDVVLHDKQSQTAGSAPAANTRLTQYNLSANSVVAAGSAIPYDELVVAPSVDPPTVVGGVFTLVTPGWYHVLWNAKASTGDTVELYVDSSALGIPVLMQLPNGASASGDTFVESDGSTTVELRAIGGNTYTADFCRITFIAI